MSKNLRNRKAAVKALKAAGFEEVANNGHAKWVHPCGVWVPVPNHRELSPGVAREIGKAIADAEAGRSESRYQAARRGR